MEKPSPLRLEYTLLLPPLADKAFMSCCHSLFFASKPENERVKKSSGASGPVHNHNLLVLESRWRPLVACHPSLITAGSQADKKKKTPVNDAQLIM